MAPITGRTICVLRFCMYCFAGRKKREESRRSVSIEAKNEPEEQYEWHCIIKGHISFLHSLVNSLGVVELY